MSFASRVQKLRSNLKRMRVDASIQRFVRHNRRLFKSMKVERPEGEVLVELYEGSQTILSFAYMANVLARKHGASIKAFSALERPAWQIRLLYRRIFKVYRSFNCDGLSVMPIGGSGMPQAERESEIRRALAEVESAGTKEALLKLKILDYEIGSDLAEAYLRECEKASIDIHDPALKHYIEWGVDAAYFWPRYFKRNKVRALVLSHGIYRYGALARIAMAEGVPVYFSSIRGVARLSPKNRVGFPDFAELPGIFKELDEDQRKKAIEVASRQLGRRFSAEVGVNMPYSTKSAYGSASGPAVMEKNDKHKVLIATHCFFDNPHAFGGNLFADFCDWVEFLGKVSEETDYDWYLKTHPDVLPANHVIIAELLARYPKIKKLPQTTSFHQLVGEGLGTALTIYGSVGHELPLLGVTVVNAGYNPHVGYDFNYTPSTREEYRDLLLRLPELRKPINPEQVYEFYYLYYYAWVVDDLMIPSYGQLIRDLGEKRQTDSVVYDYVMDRFDREVHEAALDKLAWFVESGDTNYYDHRYQRARLKSGTWKASEKSASNQAQSEQLNI